MNSAESGALGTNLNDSDIVLIFAGDFAEAQAEGYEAPCSGTQVSLSSLVREMVMAAFLSLESQGTIQLSSGKKKRLFSEHRTVFVASTTEPNASGGLEGAILKNIRPKAAENSARDIVGRIVSNTTIEPYSAIVEMSMGNAAGAGYFEEQPRIGTAAYLGRRTLPRLFQPRCERISTLVGRVEDVKDQRDTFKQGQPDLYEALYEDIEKSVRAAYFRT